MAIIQNLWYYYDGYGIVTADTRKQTHMRAPELPRRTITEAPPIPERELSDTTGTDVDVLSDPQTETSPDDSPSELTPTQYKDAEILGKSFAVRRTIDQFIEQKQNTFVTKKAELRNTLGRPKEMFLEWRQHALERRTTRHEKAVDIKRQQRDQKLDALQSRQDNITAMHQQAQELGNKRMLRSAAKKQAKYDKKVAKIHSRFENSRANRKLSKSKTSLEYRQTQLSDHRNRHQDRLDNASNWSKDNSEAWRRNAAKEYLEKKVAAAERKEQRKMTRELRKKLRKEHGDLSVVDAHLIAKEQIRNVPPKTRRDTAIAALRAANLRNIAKQNETNEQSLRSQYDTQKQQAQRIRTELPRLQQQYKKAEADVQRYTLDADTFRNSIAKRRERLAQLPPPLVTHEGEMDAGVDEAGNERAELEQQIAGDERALTATEAWLSDAQSKTQTITEQIAASLNLINTFRDNKSSRIAEIQTATRDAQQAEESAKQAENDYTTLHNEAFAATKPTTDTNNERMTNA
jgi:hypothetical protein